MSATSIATSRQPPPQVTPKLTPTELMRQRAILLAAVEQIVIQGGTPGLIAREALSRCRGEKR